MPHHIAYMDFGTLGSRACSWQGSCAEGSAMKKYTVVSDCIPENILSTYVDNTLIGHLRAHDSRCDKLVRGADMWGSNIV